MTRTIVAVVVVSCLTFASHSIAQPTSYPRPNIVLIVADDTDFNS